MIVELRIINHSMGWDGNHFEWENSLIFLCLSVCVYLLNSGVKSTHQAAVVSKIDSRLEQYTSAIEVRDVLDVRKLK